MWTMFRGGANQQRRPIKRPKMESSLLLPATCHREGSQRQLATLPSAHRYWFPSPQIFDLLQLQRNRALPARLFSKLQTDRQTAALCMYVPSRRRIVRVCTHVKISPQQPTRRAGRQKQAKQQAVFVISNPEGPMSRRRRRPSPTIQDTEEHVAGGKDSAACKVHSVCVVSRYTDFSHALPCPVVIKQASSRRAVGLPIDNTYHQSPRRHIHTPHPIQLPPKPTRPNR